MNAKLPPIENPKCPWCAKEIWTTQVRIVVDTRTFHLNCDLERREFLRRTVEGWRRVASLLILFATFGGPANAYDWQAAARAQELDKRLSRVEQNQLNAERERKWAESRRESEERLRTIEIPQPSRMPIRVIEVYPVEPSRSSRPSSYSQPVADERIRKSVCRTIETSPYPREIALRDARQSFRDFGTSETEIETITDCP